MKVFHKIFLSFADEERWLYKMNEDGYELVRASLFTFAFEKTGKAVKYSYIPLKHGRRSFTALDYKNRDADIKAVYANSEMALFKKPTDSGEQRLLSRSELLKAYAVYRSSLSVHAVVYVAVFAMLSMLYTRMHAPAALIPAALFLIIGVLNFYRAHKTEQYIKK